MNRPSGMYLTGNQLYALACNAFNFWYEVDDDHLIIAVYHDGNLQGRVTTRAEARRLIVEKFKELLKG